MGWTGLDRLANTESGEVSRGLDEFILESIPACLPDPSQSPHS